MAQCVHCDKELIPPKRKYCNDNCSFWYNAIKKDTGNNWGSKNSQIRLDKKARNFATKMRTGKTSVRYM